MYFHWQQVNSFSSCLLMYYSGMPSITTKPVKTKWIGFRGTLPDHTAIKTDAARMGVTVGSYIMMSIESFRKKATRKGR